jgi:hypothetical protein
MRYCSIALVVSSLAAAEHHGLVKFASLPLPGVTVTADQGQKRLTTITDPQGAYSFPDLPDGVWKIRVEMLCFTPQEREIGVAPGAPSAEWHLEPLPIEKIKEISPPPLITETAAPQAAPAKATAPKKKPAPQPANTATAFQRAELTAAASAPRADDPGPAAPADFNQAPSDGFLINGSLNNAADSPFAQSVAFGNNRFRRSLYNLDLGLTLNNSLWDARPYSLTGQDTPKPAYTRAQGSLTFGGPLRIPRLLPRGPDVTVTYQRARNGNASVYTGLVPTAAERAGDFAGQPSIHDPSTGLPFPGNRIPQNLIAAQADALVRLYPGPNFDSRLYNYQLPLIANSHQDALQARAIRSVRSGSFTGQFAFSNLRGDNTSPFGFLDLSRSRTFNASFAWSRRLTTRLWSTVTVQLSRESVRLTPYFAERLNVSGLAGVVGNNQEPANWGPPALSFSSGIAPLSTANSSLSRNQTGGIAGSLFWSQGAHNITAGTEYRRQQFNVLSQQDPRGSFAFTGGPGQDFAAFLLGVPDAINIAFGNADKYFRASSSAAYFTDEWRAGTSISLNLGLRWEYGSPIRELYGRLVNLEIAPGFSAATPVVSGSPFRPDRGSVQPRIGLSWRPLLASSVVVRAGYGVYYDTGIYLPIATRMAQQAPLSRSLSIQNNGALTMANAFTATPNVAAATFAADPHLQVGYSQTWQIAVQRDLPASLVGIVTYRGTKGTRSQQQFLPNTWPAGVVNPCPACPSGLIYLASNGNSIRHSAEFQLRRRLRAGFTAQLAYTFAKSIDNAALGGQGGSALIAQNWLDLAAERALSNFDQRHLVNLTAQYTTGMGIAGGTLLGGWTGALFKDWTVAGQLTAGSGLPLTPVWFAPVEDTGVTGSIRPDFTGAPLYAAPPGLHLNPASVTAPSPGHWGNAGRNSITGPAQFSLNASLARTFRLGDRIDADVRIDAINPLNIVVFSSWNAVATSTQFGVPAAANAMRNLQAVMRVRF